MRSLRYEVDRHGGILCSAAQMRLVLVLAIVAFNSVAVTESYSTASSALWAFPPLAFGGLFAIFGFMARQSRERHLRSTFALRRFRRLYPVFAFAILFASFGVGPVMSDQSPSRYFRDIDTWSYLLNLLAVPHFDLPGVFEFNVLSRTVNAMVWVMPASLVLLVAIAAGRARSADRVLIALGTALIAGAVIGQTANILPADRESLPFLFFAGPALAATLCGILGALASGLSGRVPIDRRLAIGSLVALVTLAIAGRSQELAVPWLAIATTPFTTYVALYAAVRHRPWQAIATRLQRLLPGLFWFSFPLQQVVAAQSWGGVSALINLAVALPIALALGVASWFGIERRVLGKEFIAGHADLSFRSRRRPASESVSDRLHRLLTTVALGLGLIAAVLALMALTFYAVQRAPEGL